MPNINGFATKAAALRHLREAGFKIGGLLAAPESNPKIAKNGKEIGVLTAPLHLAPYNLSGFNVCAQASAGCIAACLHTSGNPVYMEGKDRSRKIKTQAYFKERAAFLALLVFEIAALERKAAKLGMDCGVRLNATSDLPWELRKVTIDGQDVSIMELFSEVSFYDYTKITKRAIKFAKGDMPANYHITFSKTEDNDADVKRVLSFGGNVAMVAAPRTHANLLEYGYNIGGYVPTIDGDKHDFRPVDGKGVICVLKAKGDAKGDTSGFVLDWFNEYSPAIAA